MMENHLKSHWERVYQIRDTKKLGWYEEVPGPSLKLIEECQLEKEARILNVGAGTSTLVDELLHKGYRNIIASDLSSKALESLKNRLGAASEKIKWIVDDLIRSQVLTHLDPIDLWHDRAVLHFFTNTDDQNSYFKLLKKLVKAKGFVIIAAFNLSGAKYCSGLPVFRYDKVLLQKELGTEFSLITSFDYTYTMPSKETREYVYTLFQRKES
jgi:SAM-dependent methyltransferase